MAISAKGKRKLRIPGHGTFLWTAGYTNIGVRIRVWRMNGKYGTLTCEFPHFWAATPGIVRPAIDHAILKGWKEGDFSIPAETCSVLATPPGMTIHTWVKENFVPDNNRPPVQVWVCHRCSLGKDDKFYVYHGFPSIGRGGRVVFVNQNCDSPSDITAEETKWPADCRLAEVAMVMEE